MNYFDQILRFSDGSIEPEKENELFSALAYDAGLRSEFKKHLMISNSIRENNGDSSPPSDTKAGVFGALGLPLPHDSSQQKKTGGAFAGIKKFGRKYMLPIITAIIAFLLTSSFFLLFYNPADEVSYAGRQSFNSVDKTHNSPQSKSAAAASDSYEKPEVKTVVHYKYIYVPVNPDTVFAELQQENLKYTPEIIARSFNPGNSYTLSEINEKTNYLKHKDFSEADYNVIEPGYYEPLGIGVEIFNSAVRHFPYPLVQPDRYMNFTNMGAALYYNLNENIKIGADIRQETFNQEFEDEDRKYWQQPNFATLCAFVRYSYRDMGELHPFAQIEAGGNKVGPVLRGQIGFEFSPYPSVSFIIGGEYSYLSFYHKGLNFGAQKLNLNYGVNLNF